MGLISLISRYVTILFVMLCILGAILGAVAYYLLKIKKVASREEQFDYNRFERRDSLDYVRFQQIINTVENKVQTHNGLIVADDGYRYIAGLKVSGYNFFSASAQEQKQSMVGMLAFLNTIEGDIQYRQSTKAIDLSDNIEAHKKRLKEVAFEIEGLKLDHQDLVSQSKNYLDNPEVYNNYDKKITEIERTIKCKQHTENELDIVIQYMEALSGTNIEAEKVQCWLFEWSYNSNDYTEDLTDAERYEVAAQALTTKTNSYISALSRTGCTCDRMSGEELLELFRYHYAPYTSDAYSITDLYNSSVNALYVTSDSLNSLDKEASDEKEYFKIVNQEREETYAQETLEELEETMELFTDEHALVVSDETLDVISPNEPAVSEVVSNEPVNDSQMDMLFAENAAVVGEDVYAEPIQPETAASTLTTEEEKSPYEFSFAPEQEEELIYDDEDDELGDDEPFVVEPLPADENVSLSNSPVEEVVIQEEEPKKKRFHRAKKDKKKTQQGASISEGQMSIFDSVPFGTI